MKLDKQNFIKCCLGELEPPKYDINGTPSDPGWIWRMGAYVSNLCHACKKPVTKETITVYSSYWKAIWFPCHKDCLQAYAQENSYLCQCLDASCNDCKHFERGDRIDKRSSNGHCRKLDKPTIAIVNWPMHMECFEHRKD